MRDGATEGMQNFDGELDRMIRAGVIDLEYRAWLLHPTPAIFDWNLRISRRVA